MAIDFLDNDELYFEHYGRGHLDGGNSGRYPWGSGENGYQRSKSSFAAQISELKKKGLTEKQRAEALNMTIDDYRAKIALDKENYNLEQISKVIRLKESGMSITAIVKETGIPWSTVKGYLDDDRLAKENQIHSTADALKKELEYHKYIQVGSGIENNLGVSSTRLRDALYLLKEEGYTVTTIQIDQPGMKNGQKTSVKVLGPVGSTYAEIKENKGEIGLPFEVTMRSGDIQVLQYPVSLDPSRVHIRYADELDSNGIPGVARDGVIELRRGVEDLSLGDANYAQVRIRVGENKYLKGMAIYSDDLPEGVDVVFNTNKTSDVPFDEVLKTMKDSTNPSAAFGATIKVNGQHHYIDENGEEKVGVVNKVNEEGDWNEWSRTLASQMLSKQPPELAKRQLTLAYDEKNLELQKILELENPVIKRTLLDEFANDCDSSAVHLKAAAIPGQRPQVLLPLPELPEGQIYAPNFNNGDRVVLIRYPHGGLFEIPDLVVNNDYIPGKKVIGDAIDAVGINPSTAAKLSGADFDGDTALVIPNNRGEIQTKKLLDGLKDFDPNMYKMPADYDGPRVLKDTPKSKGRKMGEITNLITDMTIQGASEEELARAVRQSMVVIDSPKHHLDYQRAYEENQIGALVEKYQKHLDDPSKVGGASTLISKASSTERVSMRKPGGFVKDPNTGEYLLNSKGEPKKFMINPYTGEKVYTEAPEYYTKYKVEVPNGTYKNGKTKTKTEWVTKSELNKDEYKDSKILDTKQEERLVKTTKMAEAKDAMSLSSGTKIENIYANYANSMKALANKARKESLSVPTSYPKNKEAEIEYANEIASLKSKLNTAKKNEPLERQAGIIATTKTRAVVTENNIPEDDDEQIRKIYSREIAQARIQLGASGKGSQIQISDKEWEAIQSGGVSYSVQKEIIRYADKDRVKTLATPRGNTQAPLSKAEQNLIKSMVNSGYTQAEIAAQLDISVSTVIKYIKS